MSAISFIEFVFPQFTTQNWSSGISVYNSGGVAGLQAYGEMVSAKCKAGIGENYDVRLKLHGQGKCVQWMECTCQANRRRGEKCSHLAAFCIYLDQDKPDLLVRMNLSSGASDKYMRIDYNPKNELEFPSTSSRQAQPHVENQKTTLFQFDSILGGAQTKIQSLTFIEEEWTLLVHVLIDGTKKLSYRLGVDDSYRALTEVEIGDLAPKKIAIDLENAFYAKRFFNVKKLGKQGLQITRCLAIHNAAGEEKKIIEVSELETPASGRIACYIKKYGFVGYKDAMTPSQLMRWEEYPKNANLEGDTVAALFQSKFQRLRETAEIRLAKGLSKIQVLDALKIPELHLKAAPDGSFIVNPEFQGLSLTEWDPTRAEGSDGAQKSAESEGILLAILKARAEGRQYLATKNGWIKISDEIDWLQGKISQDGKLKLTPLEFIKFREQFARESEIKGQGDVVSRIRQGLLSTKELEYPSMASTNLTLREYQEDGVKWLYWLYKNKLGGLLADEMGLGKTHQAMGLIAAIAKEEPKKMTLVVCPTSVIDHWVDKTAKFIPNVEVIAYHGTSRRQDALKPGREHRVIITSYGILLRDVALMMVAPWSVVILDEAHLVKNQTTRTYRAACRIPSQMRLCLTGTPLENDLMELKNLFDFIAPNYLGSDSEFKKKYMMATEGVAMVEKELQRLIHPLKMRRNKRDVLKDLPEKVEDVKHCPLNRQQFELYRDALALKGTPLVDAIQSNDGPIPYIHVFSIISLLKQICNDPSLIDSRYEGVGSGKLDLFDELLREALESDQKVVVFSQYAKMIARLSTRLTAQGVQHVCLTGSSTHRGAIVKEFQENPHCKVFLGSLLAGGTGIDLTSANVVIHFDRWWNAAKENQATDRVHRIGQNRNVQVYKLVTKGTLEERIDEIINRKKLIFDRFVEQDAEVFKHLSREDLLQLLAPPKEFSDSDEDLRDESGLEALIEDGGVEAFNI